MADADSNESVGGGTVFIPSTMRRWKACMAPCPARRPRPVSGGNAGVHRPGASGQRRLHGPRQLGHRPAGGAQFKYGLLWVVALASLMAIFLQVISARLGVVTGKDLAQCCRDWYPRWTRWPNWLLASWPSAPATWPKCSAAPWP